MEFTFNILLSSLVPTPKPCYFPFDRVSLLCSCLSVLMSPTQSKFTSLLPNFPGLTWPPNPSLPFLQSILNTVYVTKASFHQITPWESQRLPVAQGWSLLLAFQAFHRGLLSALWISSYRSSQPSPLPIPDSLANTAHAFQLSHFQLLAEPFPSYSVGNLQVVFLQCNTVSHLWLRTLFPMETC